MSSRPSISESPILVTAVDTELFARTGLFTLASCGATLLLPGLAQVKAPAGRGMRWLVRVGARWSYALYLTKFLTFA